MIRKNKENSLSLEEKMKSQVETAPYLLFYQFLCPHCEVTNVRSKVYKSSIVVCSNKGCRKVIELTNINDVA